MENLKCAYSTVSNLLVLEGGMCPGAGKILSPPSGEDRDDQRGPKWVKLEDHVLHLHDEHEHGGGSFYITVS